MRSNLSWSIQRILQKSHSQTRKNYLCDLWFWFWLVIYVICDLWFVVGDLCDLWIVIYVIYDFDLWFVICDLWLVVGDLWDLCHLCELWLVVGDLCDLWFVICSWWFMSFLWFMWLCDYVIIHFTNKVN